MTDATHTLNEQAPPRSRLPSPGCLFGVTLLVMVASGGGWIGWRVHRQQARLAYFERLDAHVRMEPASPIWLHDLVKHSLGEEYSTGFTDITYVNLNGTEVTDGDLQNLAELASLRELYLDDTQITDNGLRHLSGLTNLGSLWIARTQVTDEGLRHLDGLTNLQVLVLDDLPVTDAGLIHLSGLTNLRTLLLNYTRVTDGCLQHLKELAALEVLFVVDTAVSEVGARELRAQLPQIQVYPWIVDR